MGREVRRVPPGWEHPKKANGRFKSLFDGMTLAKKQADWDRQKEQWELGFYEGLPGEWKPKSADMTFPFDEWDGPRPDPKDYMPQWSQAEAVYYQMYENTSEGTPISPIFSTPEALARWLVDNGETVFGNITATYEQWLAIAKGGYGAAVAVAK